MHFSNFKLHLKLAARNLRRQPNRTIALGGAVAFSALVMTLISGFVGGMDKAIQDNVTLYSGGHILISGYTPSWSGRLQNRFIDDEIAKTVESVIPDVRTVSPLAQARATVVFGTREIQLTLRGVDWTKDELYHDSLILSSGDWEALNEQDRSMLMSSQTADRFGLAIGDQVVVRLTTASGQQNVTDYAVSAIYDDAASGGMTTAFVSFGNLIADLNMKAIAEALTEKGYSIASGTSGSEQASQRRMNSEKAVYSISTVQELAGEIGSALGSIRWIGYAVFILMLLVSATGIANSYQMVLLERTKEIGMLRCIGFKKKDVFASFIFEGILLAGAAAFAGIICALPIGLGISFIPFDPHGDFGAALVKGHLRFAPTLDQLLIILVFIMIVAIVAVFLPARKAAEVVPVEALRITA
ncbi:MAG TPA: FtsX-like permease family protein [Rectinema sp.]|nr:FtsX-like permease family protein [Rectinema sp.]